MKARIRLGIGIVIALIVAGLGYYYFSPQQKTDSVLTSYYTYSPEDVKQLSKLTSTYTMTNDDIVEITNLTLSLIKKNELGDAYAARVFAYLFNAQRDAAYLAYQAKDNYTGSLEIVSNKILCMFFPQECETGKIQGFYYKQDPFSEKLSNIVFAKYQRRYQEEIKQTHLYPEKIGPQWWKGEQPYFGQDVGTWKPWRLSSSTQFVAPSPPLPEDNAFWDTQLAQVKDELNHATNEQIQKTVYWAGGPGTMTPPGIWINIADQYMQKQNIPFPEQLTVNANLAMAVAEACIGVFNSKYTYWVRRPFMLDSSIITIMPTPNHPSYPAGHSTISGAAEVILSYYFPENKTQWENYTYDASNSRVWGGIHFPIDASAGLKLGQQIGNNVIKVSRSE